MDGPVGTSRSAKATHWNCRWASRFGAAGNPSQASVSICFRKQSEMRVRIRMWRVKSYGIFSASF